MKRIYNSTHSTTIWRGESYTVDGNPSTVDPPLYLLTEVQREQPTYDADTQRLESLPPYADINAGEWVTRSWQVVDLTADELTAKQRATQRTALRQQWEALPSYIRGPYRDKFEAANRLLDEGDDASAIDLIDYAPPMPDFTAEQITVFKSTRASMKAGIEALP